jgi:hypothetical protein
MDVDVATLVEDEGVRETRRCCSNEVSTVSLGLSKPISRADIFIREPLVVVNGDATDNRAR